MAAPDIDTLLDFETNVENAAQIFLATDTGLSASSINLTLDQDDLELPRLEVRFDLGEALDPPDPKTTGSADLEYRKYSGVLNVMVMTRATLDGSETSHRSYRAKVRSALMLNALNFSGGTPDAIVVEGAGTDGADAVYPRNGEANGYPRYVGSSEDFQAILLQGDGTEWEIKVDQGNRLYESTGSFTATPDLAEGWDADLALNPAPTVRYATWADIDAAGIDPLTVPLLAGTEYLPYYDVNYLRPTGTDYSIDGDIAASTLTFAMNLCIRNDAWPA